MYTRKSTPLDEVLRAVCAGYRASFTGYVDHPWFGGIYTAVRGVRLYRAVSPSELAVLLRDTFADVPSDDVPIPVPSPETGIRILDV